MEIGNYRPAFFRIGEGRAFSGWKRVGSEDYWADWETLQLIARHLTAEGGKQLACELLTSPANNFGMHVVKRAVGAFEHPERLVFTADIDLYPEVFIESGERCVCVRRDRISGVVELFMEHYHARLDGASNCVFIEPHLSENILAHLSLVTLRKAADLVVAFSATG